MRDAIRPGSIGLTAAMAFSLLWAGPAAGREGAGPEGGPASTITLTRVVPVYEFENIKVPVERYQVAAGDSLAKILKARGLAGRASDQARLMRLVRELNPELKDLNRLAVGQVLNLPASSGTAALEPASTGAAIDPLRSPGGTETVKIYERPQTNQQAARVVVLRRQVNDPPAPDIVAPAAAPPAVAEAPLPKAPAAAGKAVESGPAPSGPSSPAPAAPGFLDFPSGNAGPLTQDQSGLVYRTVKIRPGDTLERLLRREGLPREAIYRHLLKITMDLNPEIKNPDLILAGAELRIPAAGDYLSAAGLDPHKVREAALAISQRRRPPPVRLAAGAAENVRRLPVEEAAKNTLALLFTRLGDRVENQGGLMLAGPQETLELDSRAYPVIHTLSGAKVVLDLGSTMPQSTMAALRSQNFQIFRTRRGEPLDRVLGNLWPLCGYYRVYTRERSYEGGGDIRLKISADWIIWPTEEAWNSGQPLVLNRVGQGGRGTDPAWSRFLGEHGLTILDLERDLIRPAPTPTTPAPAVTSLDSANPRFLAAELVRLLKAEPRPAAPLQMKQGAAIVAPLYWETGGHKVVLSFDELSPGEVADLRKNGFRVATAGLNTEAVIEAVLTGFGLKAQENLTLTAPAGGPRMTLTIKGRLITLPATKERYFLTYAALPEGLLQLMGQDLKIIRY